MHDELIRYIEHRCIFGYLFTINAPQDDFDHRGSRLSVVETNSRVYSVCYVLPKQSNDAVFYFHKSFLHLAFLYSNLRTAIRWEDGEHVIRHWKMWITHFLGVVMKNYASEAANLIRVELRVSVCHQ